MNAKQIDAAFDKVDFHFYEAFTQNELIYISQAMTEYASQQTSELKAENTRLWEEMDKYIGATKIALELTGVIALIRPLAFADHSSVEYNMEEIRKVLNAYGELPKSEGAS